MHDLVDFLVEERYCNTESEAIKIIESVSDEFYDSLVEAYKGKYDIGKRSPERLSVMRSKLKSLTNKAQQDPGSITPQMADTINKFRLSIPDQQKLASAEMERRKREGTASKGLQPTPRPGGGAQTSDIAATRTAAARRGRPMTGARLNNPRVAAAAEKETNRRTRTRGEVRIQGTGQETGTVDSSNYTDRRNVHNKATSRTGARFPG
jgi:hypothetical protein